MTARWALVALMARYARRGVAKEKAGKGGGEGERSENGHARGRMSQKGGGGDGGVEGMLAACLLGAVAKVVEAQRG